MEDCFSRLRDAIDLWQNTRTYASRAVWNGLPSDFRVRVLKFCVSACQCEVPRETVMFSSSFGAFTLSHTPDYDNQTVTWEQIRDVIPMIANAQ